MTTSRAHCPSIMLSSTRLISALATIFLFLPIASAWNITLFTGETCDWNKDNYATYGNSGFSGSMHVAGIAGDSCLWVTNNGHSKHGLKASTVRFHMLTLLHQTSSTAVVMPWHLSQSRSSSHITPDATFLRRRALLCRVQWALTLACVCLTWIAGGLLSKWFSFAMTFPLRWAAKAILRLNAWGAFNDCGC